jgi:hypothetical protein
MQSVQQVQHFHGPLTHRRLPCDPAALLSGTHACRIQELDTNPSNFNTAAQSKASAVFDSLAQSLQLHANSSGPVRSVAKLSPQLYGQFEVSAKVSMHPGVITSIDVSAKLWDSRVFETVLVPLKYQLSCVLSLGRSAAAHLNLQVKVCNCTCTKHELTVAAHPTLHHNY